MSNTQADSSKPAPNQQRTSTRGGASAFPTPANNSGGGAGWGDSGFIKGGIDSASNRLSASSSGSKLSSASGEMNSLSEQKGSGERSYQHDLVEAGGLPTTGPAVDETSFMSHKPGGSGTLPGWGKAKGALNSMMGNE